VRIQGRLALNAAEGVRAAVIAGQGFAIASRWMFQPEIASGEVVPILTEWELPQIDLWVVYPSGRLTSTKARTFALWFQARSVEANRCIQLPQAHAGFIMKDDIKS
jgi:DNA-binding transcriptional LysR family regulator